MNRPLLPEITLDPTLRSPQRATMGQFLPADDYADLYRLAAEEGACFPRIDAAGNVELYLVYESVEAFSQATQDELSVDWKIYRDKLLVIVWTVSDPRKPLGFPISLRVAEERARYTALQMVLQPFVWVHHLTLQDGQLLHIYSETLTVSPAERERVLQLVERLLAEDGSRQDPHAGPADEEIGEENLLTVDADQLGDAPLLESGLAYLFDYAAMGREHGAEGAQEWLMAALHKALLVMRRHPRSDVRTQSFTVWVAELPPWLSLIVTPELSERFAAEDSTDEAANPFDRFFMTLPQFVETRRIRPLAVGAYPLIRAEQGRMLHLELTEAFQRRLQRLFAANWPDEANPYA